MVRGLPVVDIGTFFELDKSNRTRAEFETEKNRVEILHNIFFSLKESLMLGTIWKQQ